MKDYIQCTYVASLMCGEATVYVLIERCYKVQRLFYGDHEQHWEPALRIGKVGSLSRAPGLGGSWTSKIGAYTAKKICYTNTSS